MTISLDQLQADDEARELLTWPFDFEYPPEDAAPEWFVVKPAQETKVIAQDGTGGQFVLVGDEQRLLYVSSEGEAGVIARNLTEGILLVVALPYWRDLLKFSGSGNLAEMKRVQPILERELHEDEPDIDRDRSALMDRLQLKSSADQVADLHLAVSTLGEGLQVAAPDGTKFDSLFNSFTVESNPMWK